MSFGKANAKDALQTGEHWRTHDGAKGWDDDGQVTAVLGPAGSALRTIIGNAVRDAVYEYAQSADYSLIVIKNELCLAVRYWNAQADFEVYVPLRQLIAAAAKDAYAKAADPKAQALLTALAGLAKDLAVGLNTGKGKKP